MIRCPYLIRLGLFAVAAASVVFLPGCSAPLVPSPYVSRSERAQEPDAQLMAKLRSSWFALQQRGLSEEEYSRHVAEYNHNLLLLVRRYRADMLQAFKAGNHDYEVPGIDLGNLRREDRQRLRDIFEDMVPAADIRTRSLADRFSIPGVGLPLVGIIPAEKVDRIAGKHPIRTRGTVATITAILEFSPSPSSRPKLRLINRNATDYITIRGQRHSLAGDFSAAIEIYWNLTRVKDDRVLGLLRPQELRDVSGLSCMETYSPDKIPVILTHGLLSSAGTFDNLVNRLMCDPVIRRNYQFWYFNYPTGVTWTLTAAQYREALAEVRRQLDPHHRNKNWDNMVLVGHSMGGLITHYSQCTEPWLMLRDRPRLGEYMDARYVNEPLPIDRGDYFRRAFYFRPVKAGMVVYMATPHRGAPLARYRIVTALMKLVRLPQNLIEEVINIATLQQDTVLLNPALLTEAFTSVNQLAPDSYSIKGLHGLEVLRVPTHSIIGDQGDGDTPNSSDGVVPYWSSHIPWGTETIVPSSHSVQDVSETASDFARVLVEHLRRCGRSID